MADPDPASEALIRKLHRELNGLTRRSRHAPPEPAGGHRAGRVLQDRKGHDSVSPSEEASDKGLNSRPASEGDQPSADHGKSKPKGGLQERPSKQARRASPAPERGTQDTNAQHGGQMAAVPLTPLEAAAVAASTMARAKAKQSTCAAQPPISGSRMIKCFHAGIRWGITLPADSIRKRSDLATALNDAYAGQILSCGRGEKLHIVFLDPSGQAVEFPALKSDVKENVNQWKACVDKAVRVYVMR